MTNNRPPHTFQPGLASSPMHPLMLTPSSTWLLFILIKWRPPKAKAPPLSLLFNASYFVSPSKQTNDSKRNPDGLWPVHGVKERRHHDLVAPLLYPWRERGQSHWRVGLHGSSCWLLCLCVLCFVLCATSKTIRCSQVYVRHHISYFEKWKLWAMFFGGFLRQSNYNRKKLRPEKKVQSSGRRLKWISDNQPSAVSKYEHQLQWEKITTRKKRYSCLVGYVFCWVPLLIKLRPEKITTRKKRYSHLADGWNKSQITVCRVKILTPITTQKNYDWKKSPVIWLSVGINHK